MCKTRKNYKNNEFGKISLVNGKKNINQNGNATNNFILRMCK